MKCNAQTWSYLYRAELRQSQAWQADIGRLT